MSSLGEDIHRLLAIFEPQGITRVEAETLAVLLASREEFVAHLLLRRPSFQSQPFIKEALSKLERDAPSIGANLTSNFGHVGGRRPGDDAAEKLQTALEGLIQRDIAGRELTDAVNRGYVDCMQNSSADPTIDLIYRICPSRVQLDE